MRITNVEILRSKAPVTLPEPWRAAWTEPDGPEVREFRFAFYRVTTDVGIVGYGPHSGHPRPEALIGTDPMLVGAFFERYMGGRRAGNAGYNASGLEIALWDIVGKAAGLPIHHLLGAHRERIMVYAATSRLLSVEQMVAQVQSIAEQGFRAVKLRLHRPDPWDDLAVVEAVRDAVGDEMLILVDANQNNASDAYSFWSRKTALEMAQELDALGVYYLEEPLPRTDIEGLAEIAAMVDMYIAGGEHTPTVFDLREHLARGAYDIVQPDVSLGGNMGITGVRVAASWADLYGRMIIPHVMSGPEHLMSLAATLQAMATVPNCPMIEYAYDPPVLTPETMQAVAQEPILVEEDGCIPVPSGPGLGIGLDESQLEIVA